MKCPKCSARADLYVEPRKGILYRLLPEEATPGDDGFHLDVEDQYDNYFDTIDSERRAECINCDWKGVLLDCYEEK